MKILFITPTFFPQRGGTEQVIFELTKELSKKHEITILTPQLRESKFNEKTKYTTIIRSRKSNIPILQYWLDQHYMKKEIKKIIDDFDIVHVGHVFRVGFILTWLKKFKKPILNHLLGWDTFDLQRPIPKIIWPYMKKAMNSADSIIAPSSFCANHGEIQGARSVKVIPHGTRMFETPLSGLDIREKYDVPNDHKIILTVCRLDPRKDLDNYLTAIEKLKEEKITFIIVGKGPEKERLEKKAKEMSLRNLIFAGFVADEELPDYYKNCNVFCLASLCEIFGIVYADALAHGKPLVASDNGGSRDIVNTSNGLIVPLKDPGALADAIKTVANKEWDFEQIKKNAEKYKWQNICLQFEEEYLTINKIKN